MSLKIESKCFWVGVDLMGGDHSPVYLFRSIELALERFSSIHFFIYLTSSLYDQILDLYPCARHFRLAYYIVSEVIEMSEDPLLAIRKKKSSSLMTGLKHLKKNQIQAFVFIGNTGALIAAAAVSLPLLTGIRRPALLALLPTQKGKVAVIDVGGNTSCKPAHLIQFTKVGISYLTCMHHIKVPKVGLLNIGTESKKGSVKVKQTYELLHQLAQTEVFTFVGNVEGKELFEGVVDLLVTDGFTGNVLLKTSEGVAAFIIQQLKNLISSSETSISSHFFDSFYQQFNESHHQGAILCGVERIAIKCHSNSSNEALFKGIEQAIHLAQENFNFKMKSSLKIC